MLATATEVKVRPIYDRILVSRIDENEMVGRLYIPDAAKEKPQEGVVVAVGKGRKQEDGTVIPMDVAEGNHILFGKYSGTEIKIDGKEYLIMREEEVLAVLGD